MQTQPQFGILSIGLVAVSMSLQGDICVDEVINDVVHWLATITVSTRWWGGLPSVL